MSFTNDIINEYFEWLYNYVCKGRTHQNVSYRKLFAQLHGIEFIFTIPNDINRARDGVDLRYRFAMYKEDETVLDCLDGPCSVLEMMVALSVRAEESIMDNTMYGDRTGQWFWCMMQNLGIGNMTDEIYDKDIVNECISIFLTRNYEADGRGGLFYIRNCEEDLRKMEIWIQMCWYLDNFV